MYRREQRPCHKLSGSTKQRSKNQRKHNGRMERIAYCLTLSTANAPGNEYIHSHCQSCRKAHDKRHNLTIRTNSRKRVRIRKTSHHRCVRRVEQLLQHTAQCNGECKKENLLCKRTVYHVYIFIFMIHMLPYTNYSHYSIICKTNIFHSIYRFLE